MDLVQLTEEIVKSLVVDQDAVSVKEFPTEEDNVILIQVIVANLIWEELLVKVEDVLMLFVL